VVENEEEDDVCWVSFGYQFNVMTHASCLFFAGQRKLSLLLKNCNSWAMEASKQGEEEEEEEAIEVEAKQTGLVAV
jgi:hypothetical protein